MLLLYEVKLQATICYVIKANWADGRVWTVLRARGKTPAVPDQHGENVAGRVCVIEAGNLSKSRPIRAPVLRKIHRGKGR